MKMKAAFASSLAYRPSLIILDEPFSGLDPLVRDELIEGLIERAPETTIFLSSHDLAEIESFSSHVGYLEQGRLLFSEEMSVLTGRFREVTVTLENPQYLFLRISRQPGSNPNSPTASSTSSTAAIRIRLPNLSSRRSSPQPATSPSTPCPCGKSFSPSPSPGASALLLNQHTPPPKGPRHETNSAHLR
jgi:ABC-type multidrug transport system ATPase subunit